MHDILIRGMEMPSGCSVCKLSFYDGEETVCPFCGAIMPSYSEREDSCPLVELPQQTIETNIFDIEEIHHNCTVQILKNSVTGEVSVGWWPNDNKPIGTKEGN